MADNELHARLVVHDIEGMTKAELARFQSWLRKLAIDINPTTQKEYSKKFTARLWK